MGEEKKKFKHQIENQFIWLMKYINKPVDKTRKLYISPNELLQYLNVSTLFKFLEKDDDIFVYQYQPNKDISLYICQNVLMIRDDSNDVNMEVLLTKC